MKLDLHSKWFWLVLAFAIGLPLAAFAVPAMTGNLAIPFPGPTSLWPLGGMGSLMILTLARVNSWRKKIADLEQDVEVETATRKRAEKVLREREEFMLNVTDTNPNLIFVKDRDGRFAFLNRAAALCFGGKTPEQVIGKLQTEVLPNATELDQFYRDDLEVMDTLREKFIAEEAVTDNEGQTRWFQTVKRPLIGADGKSTFVLGVSTDITGRKQAEAALASEREFLRVLMDNCPDNIYFKNLQSQFISCSKSMCAKFGMEPNQITGKTDFDFFSREHAEKKFADEQDIIRTGVPLTGKIEHNSTKDGGISWALTAKMPLRDKSNRIIGTCGISKDITAIKLAEAKLEQAHRQLVETSRLAGMAEVATSVLHNVGNVLNSVNVSTALVSEKIRSSRVGNLAKAAALIQSHTDDLAAFLATDPKGRQLPGYLTSLASRLAEEQQELLKEIASLNSNIEHIKEIVAMQQSYARISGVVETLSVTDLVEDSLRMNSGAIERHHVKVYREFDEVPPLMADKHKILQILVNLIRNAKYALDEGKPAEKRLTLRITSPDNMVVRISVIDNGVGISAENLTRIFAHGFTTRKEGHGFGLHSGALAAKELGGSLTVKSDGPGQGAVFTLELPCELKAEKL